MAPCRYEVNDGASWAAVKKTLPPAYLFLALIAQLVLHLAWPVHRYWGVPLNLIGLGPLAAGAWLNVAADREFKRHQTTVRPFERSSALVTVFPFALSRHPMYLGLTLILLGTALLFGTVSPLLPAATFALLMDRHFIPVEERMLGETFGAEWERYRERVRRWL